MLTTGCQLINPQFYVMTQVFGPARGSSLLTVVARTVGSSSHALPVPTMAVVAGEAVVYPVEFSWPLWEDESGGNDDGDGG